MNSETVFLKDLFFSALDRDVFCCQDAPGRFGEVLCGACGRRLPVGFVVGRLPGWLDILVTQRTAPDQISVQQNARDS